MSDNATDPRGNGIMPNTAKIMKNVMSSAVEAEIGAFVLNSRQAIPEKNYSNQKGPPPTFNANPNSQYNCPWICGQKSDAESN